MAKQPHDVTRHRIHAGLVVLAVEFQERRFPGTPALGKKRMVRGHVFVVKEFDRVKQMDRLDKDPPLGLSSALVLERDGTESLILGSRFLPVHDGIGMGEARVLGRLRDRKGLEAGMVSLEMPNLRECGPSLV